MATLIYPEGTVRRVKAGKRNRFSKTEINALVGRGIGFHILDSRWILVVDISAVNSGAKRNQRAMKLLWRRAIGAQAEVYGIALLARSEELNMQELVPGYRPFA
jgi:hypothetical protein